MTAIEAVLIVICVNLGTVLYAIISIKPRAKQQPQKAELVEYAGAYFYPDRHRYDELKAEGPVPGGYVKIIFTPEEEQK